MRCCESRWGWAEPSSPSGLLASAEGHFAVILLPPAEGALLNALHAAWFPLALEWKALVSDMGLMPGTWSLDLLPHSPVALVLGSAQQPEATPWVLSLL